MTIETAVILAGAVARGAYEAAALTKALPALNVDLGNTLFVGTRSRRNLCPSGSRIRTIAASVAKYLDHTPLERQVRIMRCEGLDIDSSTLWEQCERLARVLGLTAAAIRQYVVRRWWCTRTRRPGTC